MGEIADMIVDRLLFGDYGRRPQRGGFQRGAGRGHWRTAKGVMAMADMTDEHINNAIRVCEVTGNTGKLKDLRREVQRRWDARR